MLSIRILQSDDAAAFRKLRLFGLEESPSAFGQTAEEFAALETIDIEGWIRPDEHRLTVGAFEGDRLVGLGGVRRENRERMRHKAMVWGVYVLPENRGKGIARSLMYELIKSAKEVMKVSVLQLTVSDTQSTARKFYESLGFYCFGREPKALRVGDRFVAEDHMFLEI